MKKITVICFTLFLLSINNDAKAWTLFGKEQTLEIGVNTLICGEGHVGIRHYYDHYVFGIRVGSSYEDECF